MQLSEIYRRRSLESTTSPGAFSRARLNSVQPSIQVINDYCIKGMVLEARRETLPPGLKGGIIILSTDVNATITRESGFLGSLWAWVQHQYQSLLNALMRKRKALAITREMGIHGLSLGNYFRGYYRSDAGKVFSEKSLALEVLYIDSATLEKLATKLAKTFNQETVLVKDNNNNEIYFADREDAQTSLDTTIPSESE